MPLFDAPSGARIHYMVPSSPDHSETIDPSKPTVVLLHPVFLDSHFFAKQYGDARLARGYNLASLDHHYHGQTEAELDDKPYDFNLVAEDLLYAMNGIGISKAHLLATGVGAQIAVVMQTLAPERISSLLLCGLLPERETEENLEQYRFMRDACCENADDGSDRLPSDVVHGLHWVLFGEDESAQSLMEEWVETTSLRPSNKLLISKLFSVLVDRTPMGQELWDAISCPVLVIHGGNDVACSERVAREEFNRMSRAPKEFHVVADAPHLLSWTHALKVNTLLANFLDHITGVDSRETVLRLANKKSFPRRTD
ncbi:alpha/beta-hydrolase [Gautieria morchelliformis]|nr:alpha/beta-hydrolase [Gautieria morchelliformis]